MCTNIFTQQVLRHVYAPFWPQGMRQREQWAMSKALEGQGSLIEARTPINAGTPRSRAN